MTSPAWATSGGCFTNGTQCFHGSPALPSHPPGRLPRSTGVLPLPRTKAIPTGPPNLPSLTPQPLLSPPLPPLFQPPGAHRGLSSTTLKDAQVIAPLPSLAGCYPSVRTPLRCPFLQEASLDLTPQPGEALSLCSGGTCPHAPQCSARFPCKLFTPQGARRCASLPLQTQHRPGVWRGLRCSKNI